VTLTDRDKKVLLFVVPVLVIAAYWFLLLSPQRKEASKAADEVVAQEGRRDAAQAKLDAAKNAKEDFSADYTQIVRLGKAIPASVDMPSLIVQLDAAAAGTGIRFTKIKTGERVDSAASATTTPPAAPPGTAPPADPATPAAAGGEQAQSAPGGAAEAANTAAQSANESSAAAGASGVNPADTQTSTSSGSGLPVGGGTAPAPGAPGATAAAPAGLETVPLELEFTGNFFNLADFFHRVKRFVRVANANVVVSGRLLTIEGVRWSSDPEIFPKVRAEMKATVYLSPKAQGATAGATPSGPSTTTPATTTTPAQTTPDPAVAPTATASP
jgi:Tfp pilus assembly protein PilO